MTSSTPSKPNRFAGAILAEKLGKSYPMKMGPGSAQLKFNELVTRQIARCFSPAQWRRRDDRFQALQDVSFEIHAGELIGLVGSNGSGKSTLLKLLAKVTKPTSGRALLRGRVGSLLEIGTGFHPELTGYENVYLCGTILGMSRAEIAKNFDPIVAFSEIGPFLQIPIKRLSSGMAMRLAFSVAAHLNPDILLVDEALSVGDAAFQKKCIAKMRAFVASGATVIFVTHDIALVNKTCKRVLLLDKGRLVEDGPASSVMPRYLQAVNPATAYRIHFDPNPLAEKTGLSLCELTVNSGDAVRHTLPFRVDITFQTLLPLQRLAFSLALSTLDGNRLLSCDSDRPGEKISVEPNRLYAVSVTLGRLDLTPGSYLLDVLFRQDDALILDERPACLRIEVLDPEDDASPAHSPDAGTRPVFDWTLNPA
ncbi:MAG TPA: ABC transporter ATP-binding protein [Candidatus Methylacidiphilales bacterium]|jgi:lipopolysaccharide transport system ATP-binding protein|nr:ABC transporter ATP-binding protein [Candidatus Methylacidiphilales bacterium]